VAPNPLSSVSSTSNISSKKGADFEIREKTRILIGPRIARRIADDPIEVL
jgi:hypothetical protein